MITVLFAVARTVGYAGVLMIMEPLISAISPLTDA